MIRGCVTIRHPPPLWAGDPEVFEIIRYLWIPDLAMQSIARPVEDPDVFGGE
jgi:hypothetical protein